MAKTIAPAKLRTVATTAEPLGIVVTSARVYASDIEYLRTREGVQTAVLIRNLLSAWVKMDKKQRGIA